MAPRIFYRPKLNPQFVTDSKNFAKWVAQWTGPEGIKPPGHGEIEVGHLNPEHAFVHTPETNKAWHEYVDQKAGNYGDVRAASEEWFKSQGLENKVEITPHSVALEGNTNRDPIGDFTKDLFDMGGPRSRVPLGAHAYDPKGLIKWGALGAGIAGTAAAGDALATPSRVSGPTKNQWKGDLVKQFQEMTAPNRETDDVGDRVLKSFAQGFLPPSPTDIKDATSWGTMPHQMATKMASDISTQLTALQAQTGLSRKELLLKMGKEMVFSPEGVGTLLGMLLPGHIKGPTAVKNEIGQIINLPRPLRGWGMKAIEHTLPEWNILRTQEATRLENLIKRTIPEIKQAGSFKEVGPVGEYITDPYLRQLLEKQLDIPLTIENIPDVGVAHNMGGPLGTTGVGISPISLKKEISYLPIVRRAGKPTAGIRYNSPSRMVPWSFTDPTTVKYHEVFHHAMPDLNYDWGRPWPERLGEINSERAARIFRDFAVLDEQSIALQRLGATPTEFYTGVNWANKHNKIIYPK
jgi:hypothetical protein